VALATQAVSILVFLDQALKATRPGQERNGTVVSILVFLDQALKDTEKQG